MRRKALVLQLISELSHYMMDSHPTRMVISLHQEPDGLHLAVLDSVKRSPSELDAIRTSLNSEPRPELAGYYGGMAGYDSLGAARLTIVGWQLKGGERFERDRFSITDEHERTTRG